MFIVLEGIEGAGKSSMVDVVEQALLDHGLARDAIVRTREPGGTELAEKIRDLALAPRDEEVDPYTELLLMNAARSQHVHQRIDPALAAGKVVICDRYMLSTIGYQVYGPGRDEWLDRARAVMAPFPVPSLTLFLDVAPETGLARAGKRSAPDRFEQTGLAFFTRAREAMIDYLPRYSASFRIIDSERDYAMVQADVTRAIRDYAGHALHAGKKCLLYGPA